MSAAITAGRTRAMGQDEAVTGGRAAVDAPFGKALAKLGQTRPEIVGLTADLGKYTDIHPFRDAFPDRFFNVGMAEQNLVAPALIAEAHQLQAQKLPLSTRGRPSPRRRGSRAFGPRASPPGCR